MTSIPLALKFEMCRARVMPARKVPFGTGVKTVPSLTINMLAVAVSATLPMASATSALLNPLARASASMRALLG